MNNGRPRKTIKASFAGTTEIRVEYAFDALQEWLEAWDKKLFAFGVFAAFFGLALEWRFNSEETLFRHAGHLLMGFIHHSRAVLVRKEKTIALYTCIAGVAVTTISVLAKLVRWWNHLGSAREAS